MWGSGGRFYWGKKVGRGDGAGGGGGGGEGRGIVVVFAWMSSEEKHLSRYVDLYASAGWSSLVCHADFFNLFFPEKAALLASGLLQEVIKELKAKPSPLVFASFSGGPKACMYKLLQIIDGTCEGPFDLDDCRLVKDSISGYIYDSSPVDFTSDLGTRFILHPSVLKISEPPRLVMWMAKSLASGLDALFLNRFEAQRAEYWQTLYASVKLGPSLILCSEDDELAPYHTIYNFSRRLEELGGDVKVVKWVNSPHVGHFKKYPVEYEALVNELLEKAIATYSRKIHQQKIEQAGLGTSSSQLSDVCKLHRAAMSSNESFRRVAVDPTDHFFLPSSMDFQEDKEMGHLQDRQKERPVYSQSSSPNISEHSVLGQILFDVCVPKTIEDWDLKNVGSFGKRPVFGSSSKNNNRFNSMKCIRRSKL